MGPEPVKILCVDDERNVLRSLERLFLDDDYLVLTAASGEEGLDVLEKEQPVPLVISDYRMPGLNGVDFLQEVYNRWPNTIRIVLSGYADTAAVVAAINDGQIYKFIPKPWNDDELRVTIAKAVELYFLALKNQELTLELQSANQELRLLNDNLEKAVDKRTAELVFRNSALRAAQQIFDALPAVVLGFDKNGMIVQLNRHAVDFFEQGHFLIGSEAGETLPSEVLEFLSETNRLGSHSSRFTTCGRQVLAKGTVLQYRDGQEGTILLLDSLEEKQP